MKDTFERKIEAWFEAPWPWVISCVIITIDFVIACLIDSTTSAIGWGLVLMYNIGFLVKKL